MKFFPSYDGKSMIMEMDLKKASSLIYAAWNKCDHEAKDKYELLPESQWYSSVSGWFTKLKPEFEPKAEEPKVEALEEENNDVQQ
jgi:hypothetical protein